MIEITLRIPDGWLAGRTGEDLEAVVRPGAYKIKAWLRAWSRSGDGSVCLDVTASVTAPAGSLAVLL